MKHTHTETDLPIENQYPKLVGDGIPSMIERDGKAAITHTAEGDEYVSFLLTKLIEEATELKNAASLDHQKEEIADVREVLGAIQVALGLREKEVLAIQSSKFEERGGFSGRTVLDVRPE